MSRQLEPIIIAIAEDALTVAHCVMNMQGLADSKIKEELTAGIELSGNPMIHLLFNNYIEYIESGRKAGSKMPPISAIRDWALRKGLPVDNQTLYAIAKAIARDGIQPRPIMDMLTTELESAFDDKWSVDLFEYIVSLLEPYFND